MDNRKKHILITEDIFLSFAMQALCCNMIITNNIKKVLDIKEGIYYIDDRILVSCRELFLLIESMQIKDINKNIFILNFSKRKRFTIGVDMKSTIDNIVYELWIKKSDTTKTIITPTKRQWEVIRNLSNGLNAFEIAEKLNISLATVYAHKKAALSKLGLKDFFISFIMHGQKTVSNNDTYIKI